MKTSSLFYLFIYLLFWTFGYSNWKTSQKLINYLNIPKLQNAKIIEVIYLMYFMKIRLLWSKGILMNLGFLSDIFLLQILTHLN